MIKNVGLSHFIGITGHMGILLHGQTGTFMRIGCGDYGNSYITYHLVLSDVLPRKDFPVVFHGVKGSEQHETWSPPYFNIIEASIVRDYCVKLIGDRERKICKNEALFGSTCSHYCFPLHRPRGDRRSCTLQRLKVRAIRELLRVAKLLQIFLCGLSRGSSRDRFGAGYESRLTALILWSRSEK